jgi:hypothetical protein
MRKNALYLFFLAFCILFFETASLGTENKPPNLTSVFVPESRFQFAPVLDGTEIKHDFIVQNHGTAPLMIKKVRTG